MFEKIKASMAKNLLTSLQNTKKGKPIFQNIITSLTPNNGAWYSLDELSEFYGKNIYNVALSETTYYTCLRILSESIGKMPIKLYRNTPNGKVKATLPAFEILKTRPNEYLTPSQFMATLMLNTKHFGNGFAWIRRRYIKQSYGFDYKVLDYWIMPSNKVDMIVDNISLFGEDNGLYYRYADNGGKVYIFPSRDVIHMKNSFTFDGYSGVAAIDYLSETLRGGLAAQDFEQKLYKEGLSGKLALTFTSDIQDRNQMNQLVKDYKGYLADVENATAVVPVPPGLQLTPLSYKLTDAQYLELRKYTALQIAAALGIKPDQLNDYTKSSYASSEAQQLSFLVDTMMYDIKSIEEELSYKTLTEDERKEYYYKLNDRAILRVDSDTQSNIFARDVQNGIITPNECRDIQDYESIEGGDTAIVNGNYIPLTMVGQQYVKEVQTNAKE